MEQVEAEEGKGKQGGNISYVGDAGYSCKGGARQARKARQDAGGGRSTVKQWLLSGGTVKCGRSVSGTEIHAAVTELYLNSLTMPHVMGSAT